MKKIKKKRVLVILVIFFIGTIGISVAYFKNNVNTYNVFTTGEYGTSVTKMFNNPNNWIPGETTSANVIVNNNEKIDVAVRISYTESWTSKKSNTEGDLSLSQNDNIVSLIQWGNDLDWETVVENDTVYKYYKYKLHKGESTSSLLESVTFNPLIDADNSCHSVFEGDTETILCSSNEGGYDGAQYKLGFTIETVQYDMYKKAWNTNVDILSYKPLNIYTNRKIANLDIGNIVDLTTYQNGYDYDSVNPVYIRYLTNREDIVTNVSICKKNGIFSSSICLEPNQYSTNRMKVLNYFNGNENDFPSDCSDDNSSGTNELTCANEFVVIGIDEEGGVFLNDLETSHSCVVMVSFGIFNCQ